MKSSFNVLVQRGTKKANFLKNLSCQERHSNGMNNFNTVFHIRVVTTAALAACSVPGTIQVLTLMVQTELF